MLTVLFITQLHRGKQQRLKRLSKSIFTQGRSIEKHESIRKIASEIGLDSRQVDEILAGDHYAEDVRADERVAQELGITSVPFFLIEAQWVINGLNRPQQFWKDSTGFGLKLTSHKLCLLYDHMCLKTPRFKGERKEHPEYLIRHGCTDGDQANNAISKHVHL